MAFTLPDYRALVVTLVGFLNRFDEAATKTGQILMSSRPTAGMTATDRLSTLQVESNHDLLPAAVTTAEPSDALLLVLRLGYNGKGTETLSDKIVWNMMQAFRAPFASH